MLGMILLDYKIPKSLGSFDHEHVYQFSVRSLGLRGFIAIHNTHLGPAVGGTRMFPYLSDEAALQDVLKLSKSMTSKCAIAGVPFGGGKSVIIGNEKNKSLEFWHAYAEVINSLRGQFYTGADVGISEADVQLMLEKSPYFIGRSGQAADPSPYASLSTFYAIQAASNILFKDKNYDKKNIAVKGVGKVGGELVHLLIESGFKVTIADINIGVCSLIQKKFPNINIVSPEIIFTQIYDVYSPCAMGNDFTMENINLLKTKLICGGANNQLQNEYVGDILHQKGITYIPDYMVNVGGLIDVVSELDPAGYNRDKVIKKIMELKELIIEVLQQSIQTNLPPYQIAKKLVYEKVNSKR